MCVCVCERERERERERESSNLDVGITVDLVHLEEQLQPRLAVPEAQLVQPLLGLKSQ